jgi:hypothetical protein
MKAHDRGALARPVTAIVFAAALSFLLGGCEDLFTFNVFGGGNDPSESIENKIAFELSGAADHNGRYVYVSVTAADDAPTNVIATGQFAIAEGAGSAYAMTEGQAHSFTAGSSYDVYAFIDVDDSGVAGGPNSGDYVFDPNGDGHATVTVDGDTTVTAVYPDDFVAVP